MNDKKIQHIAFYMLNLAIFINLKKNVNVYY